MSAERFGLEISLACEWELRELEAYVGSLLGHARAERERNPLRPELIGNALIRSVEAVVDRADARKLLGAEFSRSLSGLLRTTYADIISDMRDRALAHRMEILEWIIILLILLGTIPALIPFLKG